MSFSSKLYKSEPIIHDSTPMDYSMPPKGIKRGLLDLSMARGVGSDEYAYEGTAEPFPQDLRIPKNDWEPMIKEAEEKKNRVTDEMRRKKLPEKNQANIPYCWIFGPVQCVEVLRMQQNQRYTSLSPASAGAPIKNFRAVGGWGKEGLEYIVDHGLVPSKIWPDTSLNRQYWTEENKKIALKYRVQEWWE
jgi:hypothetical protein